MADREEPWYLRMSPPVFCNPCMAIFEAIFPATRCTFILGVALWIIGFIIFLAVILTCIASFCSGVAAGLFPVSILLMWVGYALFHCGWAAHLLEHEPVVRVTTTTVEGAEVPLNRRTEDGAPFETANDVEGELPETRKGYWQFVEKEAWQTVATRDKLQ